MATGIIGTFNGVSSMVYTAPCNAKMVVTYSLAASSAISLNGVPITSTPSAVFLSQQSSFYVGAGQTITLSTSTGSSGVVSVIEEI